MKGFPDFCPLFEDHEAELLAALKAMVEKFRRDGSIEAPMIDAAEAAIAKSENK